MHKPLKDFTLPGELGSFGVERKHDVHAGIDLYAPVGAHAHAIEDGRVIAVVIYTGEIVCSGWWNETQAVLIKGKDRIWLYGEINSLVNCGDFIKEGQVVGTVMQVLKKDKGITKTSMLHLELYEPEYTGAGECWTKGQPKPKYLLDPTPFIMELMNRGN